MTSFLSSFPLSASVWEPFNWYCILTFHIIISVSNMFYNFLDLNFFFALTFLFSMGAIGLRLPQ